MAEYSFQQQLALGHEWEIVLDDFFRALYTIQDVSLNAQRLGIDRLFQRKADGAFISVEYKTDFKAKDTGNAFLETEVLQQDGKSKPGWAIGSLAQAIVYFTPHDRTALFCDVLKLKCRMKHWRETYPLSSWVVNREDDGSTYRARGRLVPLSVLEKECSIFRQTVR